MSSYKFEFNEICQINDIIIKKIEERKKLFGEKEEKKEDKK